MELLQQARLIDPTQGIDRLSDILIAQGQIKAIAPQITDYPAETQVISRPELIVGTGLVDLYSHAQEPGHEARESLLELAQAATAGGFRQIGILPDTKPCLDSLEMLNAIQQKSALLTDSQTQFVFWGAASETQENSGKQMTELAELKSQAIGFYDRFNLSNLNLFKQLLEYVQPWQKPIAIALNRNELTNSGVIREGVASLRYGLAGDPYFSESAIIAAVIEIVAAIPTPVHIMRVSTQRGVALIADAKERNLPITASTTWMHLLWNSEAISTYDPNLHLETPLGNANDQQALITGIKQGIIDAIAIDHQAYTYEEKTVPFGLAPPGVIGLEFALPILWQQLVTTNKLSAIELWQALSTNPCLCLQQQPLEISLQKDNNFIIFDSAKTWFLKPENLKSSAMNSPFYQQEIAGKVISTAENLSSMISN